MPLKIAILASGSGTNAQAMIDKSADGILPPCDLGGGHKRPFQPISDHSLAHCRFCFIQHP